MSNKISISDLNDSIFKVLSEYKENIDEEVKETANKIAKEAKEDLISNSPRSKKERGQKYYKGWAIKKKINKKGKYVLAIWNKTNYRLTHLLEFGHNSKNGEKAKAVPHIRKVEEKMSKEFEEELKKKISKGV